MRRRIELPVYLVVLLLVALSLNLVRGFDLARRRSTDLQPVRSEAILDLRTTPSSATNEAPPSILEVGADERFVLVHLQRRASARLALHQMFPERDILRWMEDAAGEGEWLILPLAGLPEGEFAFRWAVEGERAEAVDPDWEQPERIWLGGFRIPRR